MIELCSIASGSGGNCTYIGDGNTHILIDAGVSKKRIVEGLSRIGIKGEELSAVFITHEHTDHIQGLGVFSRQFQIPIYATAGTLRGIGACQSLGEMPGGLYQKIVSDETISLGDLSIHPFTISHDANEPVGYRVQKGEKAVAVATDMGTYDDSIVQNLQGVSALLLEANHDVRMLEAGNYPYALKQRVLGERGHLSNELSGRLLCDILHDGLKQVILGHLSKENNYEELAYETVKLEITLGDVPYRGEDVPIRVADRMKGTEKLAV